MITPSQIDQLAQGHQIDKFTIFREYLQLLVLSYLYEKPAGESIFFKGGTALRLLFNSPRFSEDLDFTASLGRQQIDAVLVNVHKNLVKELRNVDLKLLHPGMKSVRYRIRYRDENFKYPFGIRLDITPNINPQKTLSSSLVTDFPIRLFPIVQHFSAEEILAEKIRAFLMRGKGRDIFDLWYLLEKKTQIDIKLVKQKMHEVDLSFDKNKLKEKVKRFPIKKLQQDLQPFLPRSHRKIISQLPTLLHRLLEKAFAA